MQTIGLPHPTAPCPIQAMLTARLDRNRDHVFENLGLGRVVMGLCKPLITRWRHRVSAASFERIHFFFLPYYILYKYTVNSKKNEYILNPTNESYQSCLVSMQLK